MVMRSVETVEHSPHRIWWWTAVKAAQQCRLVNVKNRKGFAGSAQQYWEVDYTSRASSHLHYLKKNQNIIWNKIKQKLPWTFNQHTRKCNALINFYMKEKAFKMCVSLKTISFNLKANQSNLKASQNIISLSHCSVMSDRSQIYKAFA